MLEVLRYECGRVKQRYPGYGEALLRAVVDIVEIEGRPRTASSSPAPEVQRVIEILADLVLKAERSGR
jgi:hypothetical protein